MKNNKVLIYVFWIAAAQKVCVDLYQEGASSQELILELKDLGLHSLQELKSAAHLDTLLLPFISFQNGNAWFSANGTQYKISQLKQ